MSKKYELLKTDTKCFGGARVYRIQALRGFGAVCEGELGGYIEKESNLAHDGDCWVFDDAWVVGSAQVYGNGRVYGGARVYDDARVFRNAKVYDGAWIFGNSWVFDEVKVYDDARVYGNAKVYDGAQVYGGARVYDDARVSGDARVGESLHLCAGNTTTDLSNNFSPAHVLIVSVGAAAYEGKVILYKRVNKISPTTFSSLYDENFIYELGKTATASEDTLDTSMISCANGLHASHPVYWKEGNTLIAVEIKIKDIITIQEGKVRCKKLKVLGIAEEN